MVNFHKDVRYDFKNSSLSFVNAANDYSDRKSPGQHSTAEPIVRTRNSFHRTNVVFRHQIQHYTQQLAKDSSKQLQELNNYGSQEAADPR